MPKKICHLLIVFGNKNQEYTKNLLERLSEASTDEHFVFCHKSFLQSDKIKLAVSAKRPTLKNLFQIIRFYILDSDFRKLTLKINRHNIFKWIGLITTNIDTLHIHHAHAIPVELIEYFKKKKTKIIISLRGRDLLVNTKNTSLYNNLKAKLKLADKIHCISHFMKNELLKKYSLDSVVVYRGQPLPELNNLKQSKKLTDKLKIIAVGRLVWEKGHIYLIESIFRLLNKGLFMEVDIYGEGELYEFLQFRINQLGLEKNVHLKGFKDNAMLKTIYKDYDIVVQPSLTEALSNGLIDFMFHNLPCVITDVGGMLEVIENNKNGIVINRNNMISMDEAILKAKEIDFAELIQYNNKIKNKFSAENEVKGMLDLYN